MRNPATKGGSVLLAGVEQVPPTEKPLESQAPTEAETLRALVLIERFGVHPHLAATCARLAFGEVRP